MEGPYRLLHYNKERQPLFMDSLDHMLADFAHYLNPVHDVY